MLDFSYGFNLGVSNNGNVLSIANNRNANRSQMFTYDELNRMVSINGGGGNNPEYIYDANGRRVRKKIGSTLTEFIYDVAGSVVAERESTDGGTNWTWTKGYVYVGGQMLVQYNGVIGAGGATAYFAHKDHLGSTRLLTTVSGTVQQASDFLPFGESSSCMGSGTTDLCFTGQKRDSESGLDYFIARHYLSQTARFQSPDPENTGATPEDPQSWNAYAYARNNPIIFVDPDGLKTVLCVPNSDNVMKCTEMTEDDFDQLKENPGPGIMISGDESGVVWAWNEDTQSWARVGYFIRNVENDDPGLEALSQAGERGETGVKAAAVVIGIPNAGAMAFTVGVTGGASYLGNITGYSRHAAYRMATRGITRQMVDRTLTTGQKFWDPVNKTIVRVLTNGTGTGKDVLVAVSQESGQVTTVIKGMNLILPRFVPIP